MVKKPLNKLTKQELLEQQKLETYIKSYVTNLQQKRKSGTSQTVSYTIPVVVHVLEHQGYGHVEAPQINSAIDLMNTDFNGLNPDWTTIDPAFDPIKASLDIQFVLAKLDPQGNPTTGIVYS